VRRLHSSHSEPLRVPGSTAERHVIREREPRLMRPGDPPLIGSPDVEGRASLDRPRGLVRDAELGSYGSHLPALLRVVMATEGPVLELGSGYWSTPTLHEVCQVLRRDLISLDSDTKFIEEFRWLERRASDGFRHIVRGVPDWVLPDDIWKRRFAVVLIDCAPATSRLPLLELARHHADFLVCHDTQVEVVDRYWRDVLSQFRFRRDFPPAIQWHPWTSVVSDVSPIP
jgi:hypothetical protein